MTKGKKVKKARLNKTRVHKVRKLADPILSPPERPSAPTDPPPIAQKNNNTDENDSSLVKQLLEKCQKLERRVCEVEEEGEQRVKERVEEIV